LHPLNFLPKFKIGRLKLRAKHIWSATKPTIFLTTPIVFW
jgi:hypothetical protein